MGVHTSRTGSDETSHCLYIYSGILSIFRPAFFKPPWAGLQILDHQARLPDCLILSYQGDRSWLQNSSPHVRRKSHPENYMSPITLLLDFHWDEPKVFSVKTRTQECVPPLQNLNCVERSGCILTARHYAARIKNTCKNMIVFIWRRLSFKTFYYDYYDWCE